MKSYLALAFAVSSGSLLHADAEVGKAVFATYCASCHGPEGAGLIGPNLTDAEILHGSSHAEIVAVVRDGVPSKAMPAWSGILQPDQIDEVAAYVKSIMGKDLAGPGNTDISTITPFPEGTLKRPLLMRTFMPVLDLDDEVFSNHYISRGTPSYSPKTGSFDPMEIDEPIEGIPGAIAVHFGDQLSYCFDSTECRLLYTWSGGFMDMTNYWGSGTGGGRVSFGYIGELVGTVQYMAEGPAPLAGKPAFKGYRKVNDVPEFMYSIGDVDFTLKIMPGEVPGEAVCHYTSQNWTGKRQLRFSPHVAAQMSCDKGEFENGTLTLSAKEAKAFTITIKAGN